MFPQTKTLDINIYIGLNGGNNIVDNIQKFYI